MRAVTGQGGAGRGGLGGVAGVVLGVVVDADTHVQPDAHCVPALVHDSHSSADRIIRMTGKR